MQTKVQKWGNSLALRIPKTFAQEVGLHDDATVDIALVDGRLVIVPLARQSYTLHSLLAQITDENLHNEMMVDSPVGNESW